MLKKVAAAIAASTFALVGFVGSANALTFDRDFIISANDFATSAPIDTVNFSFNAELNPAVDSGTTTQGLTVNSLNLSDPVEYNYNYFGSSTNPPKLLTVGSDVEVAGYSNDPNEFGVFIQNAFTTDPQALGFSYTDAAGITYVAGNLTLKYTDKPITTIPAAPEPAIWALMFFGVAIVGGALRTTRRNSGVFKAAS